METPHGNLVFNPGATPPGKDSIAGAASPAKRSRTITQSRTCAQIAKLRLRWARSAIWSLFYSAIGNASFAFKSACFPRAKSDHFHCLCYPTREGSGTLKSWSRKLRVASWRRDSATGMSRSLLECGEWMLHGGETTLLDAAAQERGGEFG
jgi:hypothetical protein